MKTKRFLQTLCLVLLAIIVMAIPADATYQVPDRILQSDYLEFTPDPNGPSMLFSVHNTDDDPVTIEVQALNTAGQVVQGWTYELVPYDIKSINMRDILNPANYTVTDEFPQGIFRGGIVVFTTREVLLGDEFFVNNNEFLADIETLNTKRGECDLPCEKYFVRYLQGGVFSGGTCIDIKHTGGFNENPSVNFQLFNEDGEFTDNFTLGEVPVLSRTCLSDYSLTSNFGGMYINVPGSDMPTITATYIGFGHFSGKLKAQCIPHCDPCDALGRCYDENAPGCGPVCRPPNLTITPGGSLVCQVGVPFNAHLQATGTGLGEITCDLPLPDGITFNPNTDNLTGVCQNMNIPSGTCRVSGQCGADTYTFLVTPPGSTYGVGVAVDPRDKDCLAPGETTAEAHVDFHITNTGNVAGIFNLTTSIPGCNFTNISIAGGGNTSRSCVGDFPFGTTTVTATASIVGRPETATSEGQVVITNCPVACDGVQPPTFNFSILSENNATATTRSNLSYSGPGVSGTVNFSPPPSGGFTGGNVTSGSNNDSVFPKTANDYTATANWQVIKGGEVCHSGSANVIIHEQAGCDAYPVPTITLTETSVLTATDKIVNIVPNPAGGTFNRPVPVTIPRPLFGQPAGSENFLYTLPYIPDGTNLHCTATKPITVTVPPRDPGCADFPVDVIEGNPQTTLTSTSMTVTGLPFTTSPNTPGTMVWTPSLPSGPHSRPLYGQPAGSVSFTGVYTYIPASGLTCTAPAARAVPIPPRDPQCSDFPTPPAQTFTPNTTLNTTTMVVNSISASPGLTGGAYNPTLPRTFNRPAAGQPAGTASFTYSGTWAPVTGLSCSASYPVSVPIPPQSQTCANFPVDVIEGTPTTTTTSTAVTVTALPYTTSPNTAGTMVWTPTLPKTVTRPLFGQPAGSQSFTGVFTYTPPSTSLTCTASAAATVPIPAQSCETSNPPTWTVPSVTQGSTNLSANNSVGSTGEWELNIHATSSLTECNNHNYDHWYKDSEKVDLACGQGTTALSVSYQWAGHPDEYWRVEVIKNGTRVWESSCLLNTHNLMEPSIDKDLMIDDGVVNAE